MASRSIEEVAERQVRKWELASTQRKKNKTPIRPVITISRQHGTAGEQLGKLIAERLGYDFWDQQIVHEMADNGQMSEVLLSSLDEHPKNAFVEAFAAFAHTGPTSSQYMRELWLQLHTIAHHGAAVVVGRGAQFTLEPAMTFRVRIVAPREYRIRQIAAIRGIEEKDASAVVDRVDAERAKFIHEQWSNDINDIYAYDLLVNLEHLDMDSAADGIIAAYRRRFNLPS